MAPATMVASEGPRAAQQVGAGKLVLVLLAWSLVEAGAGCSEPARSSVDLPDVPEYGCHGADQRAYGWSSDCWGWLGGRTEYARSDSFCSKMGQCCEEGRWTFEEASGCSGLAGPAMGYLSARATPAVQHAAQTVRRRLQPCEAGAPGNPESTGPRFAQPPVVHDRVSYGCRWCGQATRPGADCRGQPALERAHGGDCDRGGRGGQAVTAAAPAISCWWAQAPVDGGQNQDPAVDRQARRVTAPAWTKRRRSMDGLCCQRSGAAKGSGAGGCCQAADLVGLEPWFGHSVPHDSRYASHTPCQSRTGNEGSRVAPFPPPVRAPVVPDVLSAAPPPLQTPVADPYLSWGCQPRMVLESTRPPLHRVRPRCPSKDRRSRTPQSLEAPICSSNAQCLRKRPSQQGMGKR